MTTIAFVRHGVTDWNIENRFQGHTDIPLNEEGRAQAALAALRLARDPYGPWDYVFSSDLGRAMETANTIGKAIDKPVTADVRLREKNQGRLEGSSHRELEERWGLNWRDLDHGGETYEVVRSRGLSFINEIVERYANSKIIVASHGGLISQTLLGLLQLDEAKWRLGNTSVSILRRDESGRWNPEILNCTQHLG